MSNRKTNGGVPMTAGAYRGRALRSGRGSRGYPQEGLEGPQGFRIFRRPRREDANHEKRTDGRTAAD